MGEFVASDVHFRKVILVLKSTESNKVLEMGIEEVGPTGEIFERTDKIGSSQSHARLKPGAENSL